MASYTSNLNLLKKDPATEGSDTFNITTMLNDNWDKLDTAWGTLPSELSYLHGVTSNVQTQLNGKQGKITVGTTDLEDGVSSLPTGQFYAYYVED